MAVLEGRGAVIATLIGAWTAVAGAGCASSPYAAQQNLAEQNIVRAEAGGVDDGFLEEARDLLEQAEDAEARALDEREDASEDLGEARSDAEDAKGRVAMREERLRQTMSALTAAEAEVVPVEEELE